MATRNTERRLATAQDVGGAPDEELTDRVRAATLRTASGDRVLVAVVADGEGAGAAKAAARTIDLVFQMVQASPSRELAPALQRGLEIADQGLRKSASHSTAAIGVAATAVAVWRSRLYCAHVGRTLAIRISSGHGNQLTRPSSDRLGGTKPPQIQSRTVELRRGDRIVLASDGMARRNPETGGAFVGQDEIAQHATELSPSEAARHLVSLALGRDVDDNVSVAVFALPGRQQPARRRPRAAIAAGLLLIGAVIVGALLLNRPSAPATADYGYAVLIDGGVLADPGSGKPELVPRLGTIPSGSFLTASTDAKLGVQSTFQDTATSAQGTLYLEQASGLELTGVDPRPRGDNPAPLGTDLTLGSGRLLIVRESGTWEFRVHANGATVSLLGAGRAALGLAVDSSGFLLSCLAGTCAYTSEGGVQELVQAGELVPPPSATTSDPAEASAAELLRWDALCGGCLYVDE